MRTTTGTPELWVKQTELEAVPDSEAHWAVQLESSKWWQAEQAGAKAVAVGPKCYHYMLHKSHKLLLHE